MTATIRTIIAERQSTDMSTETSNNTNMQPELAKVVSVDPCGRVNQASLLENNCIHQVTAQAQHITCAAINDTVLVQQTSQGWMVIAQLANSNDSPAAHITDHQGHVKVKGAKSVTLSTSKGAIEVHEDGKIILDGAEISASSERDLTIAGWPIRLN